MENYFPPQQFFLDNPILQMTVLCLLSGDSTQPYLYSPETQEIASWQD